MDMTPHRMPRGGVRYGQHAYAAEAFFQIGERNRRIANRKRRWWHRKPRPLWTDKELARLTRLRDELQAWKDAQ